MGYRGGGTALRQYVRPWRSSNPATRPRKVPPTVRQAAPRPPRPATQAHPARGLRWVSITSCERLRAGLARFWSLRKEEVEEVLVVVARLGHDARDTFAQRRSVWDPTGCTAGNDEASC
jgi:hypothetical protein